MDNKEFDLSVSCYGAVKDVPYDMAILPWGATEPHNLHLPYMTDCILSHDVAVEAARHAWEQRGVKCMVLPAIPMGSQNPGQRELKFCIHSHYETQKAILTDVVASLHHQGMDKLLIVNGHGGNAFKNMIRDLACDYPDFLVASSEWYTFVPAGEYFDEPGDHAGELETAVMMHFHPELVRLEEAGAGSAKHFSSKVLRDGVAWVPRNWQQVTADTGIGDPRRATAEKGARYVAAVVSRYVDLLADLSAGISYSD